MTPAPTTSSVTFKTRRITLLFSGQVPTGSWWLDQRVRTGSMKLLFSAGDRILEPYTVCSALLERGHRHGHSDLIQATQTDPPDPTMPVPPDNSSKLTDIPGA
jgi:hypothetical protein